MNRVEKVKLSKWESFMAVALLILVSVISSQAGKLAAGGSAKISRDRPVVVIDAGHGGS